MNMTRALRSVLLWSILGLAATMDAQEHPFLSYFQLRETAAGVELDWEMVQGNTCEGIEILRALDPSALEVTGSIPGLCGSISEPVPYTYTDTDPPELNTVYYRLKLGTNGFSSVRSITLTRLRSTDHRVYPSPASNIATLLLRETPGATFDVQVIAASGVQVMDMRGLKGDRVEIDVAELPAGTYIYRVSYAERRLEGRFSVMH